MKLWYVAHPYTGDRYRNDKLAITRTNHLIDRGFFCLGIITMTHPLQEFVSRNVGFWYAYDLELLAKCDGIILCPKWEHSIGCIIEKEYAEKYGLDVLYYDEIMNTNPWRKCYD